MLRYILRIWRQRHDDDRRQWAHVPPPNWACVRRWHGDSVYW
jgi:hypothetical protein